MPKIVLFPMMHIGEENFYSEVKARVSNSDLILTEGVSSKTSSILTLSYRLIEKNPRTNLITQPKLCAKEITGKILHADVDSHDFERQWNRLPLWFRIKSWVLFPFFGIHLRFFGTRESVVKNMNTEMLQSRVDVLEDDQAWEQVKNIILDWRDVNLLNILNDILSNNQAKDITISIVYGAEHMRAISKFLLNYLDFRVTDSEWLDLIRL